MRHRWVAALHPGQLAIVMVAVSLLAYGVMSVAATLLFDASHDAFGQEQPREYWGIFLVGFCAVLAAHFLAHAWAKGRKLPTIPGLLIALWLPGIFGVWSYRSYVEANRRYIAYENMPLNPGLDSIPPGRIAFEMAYKNVASDYAIFFTGSILLATVMLFLWFGRRRLRTPTPIESGRRSHDELEALVVARTAELAARTALLSTSEEQYRRIVDTALNAVVAMDGTGLITGWNPQAEKMFGWSHAEAVGQRMSETIIPQRFREAHENGLKRFFETGEGAVLNKRIEITGLRRDGVEFPVELAISSPVRISSGWMFNAFIRDLTERNTAAEAIRLGEQRYNELEKQFVTLCAWSNTVMHEGEWVSFPKYLESRFGLATTHGISPEAAATFDAKPRGTTQESERDGDD